MHIIMETYTWDETLILSLFYLSLIYLLFPLLGLSIATYNAAAVSAEHLKKLVTLKLQSKSLY